MKICLTSERDTHFPSGLVLDDNMKPIGSAESYSYGGTAFAVHTQPFAGYVPFRNCTFYRVVDGGYYPVDLPNAAKKAHVNGVAL